MQGIVSSPLHQRVKHPHLPPSSTSSYINRFRDIKLRPYRSDRSNPAIDLSMSPSMASMLGAGRITLFNIARFPTPSLHLCSQRVSFPLARRSYSQGYSNAASDDRDAKEKAREGMESVKKTADEAKERAKENTEEAKEKVKETAGEAREKMTHAKEKTKEAVSGGAEKVSETAEAAKEKGKEGAGKVMEGAQAVGEKAKQTVQGVWEATKETTQKIKETVVGRDDEKAGDDPSKIKDGDWGKPK